VSAYKVEPEVALGSALLCPKCSDQLTEFMQPIDKRPVRALSPIFERSVDELEFGENKVRVRIRNRLANDGIKTIGDLVRLTEGEVLGGTGAPNLGRKSLNAMREALARCAPPLRFGMVTDPTVSANEDDAPAKAAE
jgi:DNA-directed RNA polymerase alpha subunit